MYYKQFKQITDTIRCLNTIGYMLYEHVRYNDGSQTMFFKPYGEIDTTIRPESIAKMLSSALMPEMCVTCIRLDSVQLHILKKGKVKQ